MARSSLASLGLASTPCSSSSSPRVTHLPPHPAWESLSSRLTSALESLFALLVAFCLEFHLLTLFWKVWDCGWQMSSGSKPPLLVSTPGFLAAIWAPWLTLVSVWPPFPCVLPASGALSLTSASPPPPAPHPGLWLLLNIQSPMPRSSFKTPSFLAPKCCLARNPSLLFLYFRWLFSCL